MLIYISWRRLIYSERKALIKIHNIKKNVLIIFVMNKFHIFYFLQVLNTTGRRIIIISTRADSQMFKCGCSNKVQTLFKWGDTWKQILKIKYHFLLTQNGNVNKKIHVTSEKQICSNHQAKKKNFIRFKFWWKKI